MMKTVTSILQQGIEAQRFCVRDLNRDVEVFLYAIAYFYPVAGKETYHELTEDALLNIVEWFLEQWARH